MKSGAQTGYNRKGMAGLYVVVVLLYDSVKSANYYTRKIKF